MFSNPIADMEVALFGVEQFKFWEKVTFTKVLNACGFHRYEELGDIPANVERWQKDGDCLERIQHGDGVDDGVGGVYTFAEYTQYLRKENNKVNKDVEKYRAPEKGQRDHERNISSLIEKARRDVDLQAAAIEREKDLQRQKRPGWNATAQKCSQACKKAGYALKDARRDHNSAMDYLRKAEQRKVDDVWLDFYEMLKKGGVKFDYLDLQEKDKYPPSSNVRQ